MKKDKVETKEVIRELTVNKEETSSNTIKLNLGSGLRPIEGYVNIDNRECVNPDVFCDIEKNGLPFEDNSVEEVFARDFLEHIRIGKTISVIEEIYRVLKPGGKFESLTPSTDLGRAAWQDPTHCSFWNANSFLYYCDDDHRNLYNIKAKFSGTVNTIITNKQLQIAHVHAVLYAEK